MRPIVALLLVIVLAGVPAAFAQSGGSAAGGGTAPAKPTELHVAGKWRLPVHHSYETWADGQYHKLPRHLVVPHLEKGQPVYDRTANVWVHHPNSGADQRYLVGSSTYPPGVVPPAATPAAPRPPAAPPHVTKPSEPAHRPPVVSPPAPSPPAPTDTARPAAAPAPAAVSAGSGPETRDDCKKGGWKEFTDPSFKNQGQCIKWVNQNRKK